jgi:predicted transcriptional regulator
MRTGGWWAFFVKVTWWRSRSGCPCPRFSIWEQEIQRIGANTVAQAMTADPVTISPDTSLEEIASLMVDRKLHTLPVVESGKLVGVVGKEDILRTLLNLDAVSR